MEIHITEKLNRFVTEMKTNFNTEQILEMWLQKCS